MPTSQELLHQLEEIRQSKLICYVTGDRENQQVQIGSDALPILAQHLFEIGKTPKLDLFIYSRGGDTLTGFALANALREFGTTINLLVPFRAHSCATLIALGAETIVAGPFAQLSPIDPSVNTPHGPTVEQQGVTQFVPVSVEDVANYFALARNEAGLQQEQFMATVLGYLAERISPLALGAVYRAREQIGMLASKLLNLHMKNDSERIDRIVRQLTRELLSHDYMISRREAIELGLPVTNATEDEALLMWNLYESMANELKLSEPWNWEVEASLTQPRTCTRAIIESFGIKHEFSSRYQIKRVTIPTGTGTQRQTQTSLQITPIDTGSWKKVVLD